MNNEAIKNNTTKWNAISKELADEGIVLLKNKNNALPLKNEQVAVFGQAQYIRNKKNIKGNCIIKEMQNFGMNLNKDIFSLYESWNNNKAPTKHYQENIAFIASEPEMPLSLNSVKKAKADGAEKAIIVISRASWENSDMAIEKGDYLLTDEELQMIDNVCHVFDSVILILHIGCNIDLGFLDDYKIDAIIYTSLLKQMGAVSLVDILNGKVNPSGKLTFTMAKHYEDYISSQNFGRHGGGLIQDYREDIFVGYRYFDTFNKNDSVVFPFGTGCSYTDFSLDNIRFSIDDKINISVDVTNIGEEFAGKETVQLYFSAPNLKDGAKLSKPQKELCGFEKTKLLGIGETETLNFSISPYDLKSYDDTGKTGEKSVWVLEKGYYSLYIGNGSNNLVKAGVYEQKETEILERCHKINTTLPERILEDGSFEELPTPTHNAKAYLAIPTDRTVKISVENYFVSDNENIKSLADLKNGQSITYRLMPGAGGSYKLRFNSDGGNVSALNKLTLKLNGSVILPKQTENGEYEISLPLERSEMTVIAKDNAPDVNSFEFEKIDNVVKIKTDKTNIIPAQNFYEGSFSIDMKNDIDKETNTAICYVTNFIFRGMNVTYKLDVEKAGHYDIFFKYAFTGERVGINRTMTVSISNIVQHLSVADFETTYKEGETRKFALSDGMNIFLPAGTVYLKVVCEAVPFPDISEIHLTHNESAVQITDGEEIEIDNPDVVRNAAVLPADNGERNGMQLSDVVNDPTKMGEFLNSLSNSELATIVSGTGLNAIPNGYVGCNHPIYERGIMPAQTADGPGGIFLLSTITMSYSQPIIITATFNKELFGLYGDAIGEEASYYGVDLWLAPAINILRSPCGGRNYSYSSEDPYLSAVYATEQIKSLQSYNVGAVLKHYCANTTEYERLKSNSRVSERALREIYIKAFELTVKNAEPYAIMSSYNHVNNVKVCEDYTMITEIPRDEWGWQGVFVTDWWNDSNHIEEIRAGHDLKMATGDIDGVTAALDSGELSREECCICAERVLNMLIKLKKY